MELATPEQTLVGVKTIKEVKFSRNRVEQRLYIAPKATKA